MANIELYERIQRGLESDCPERAKEALQLVLMGYSVDYVESVLNEDASGQDLSFLSDPVCCVFAAMMLDPTCFWVRPADTKKDGALASALYEHAIQCGLGNPATWQDSEVVANWMLYAEGCFCEYHQQNYKSSFECYSNAAERGSVKAMISLSLAYQTGKGVPRDYSQARKWLFRAVETGYDYAESMLASSYFNGDIGLPVDKKQAFQLYHRAADKGNANAQWNLAACYASGHGTEKDLDLALEWYLLAANQGYPKALTSVGLMYLARLPEDRQNHSLGVEYLERAADFNEAEAYESLGTSYWYGKGVEKDYKKSFAYQVKAAERGDARAIHHIGCAYLQGKGVKADKEKSLNYFAAAAKEGVLDAMGAWLLVKTYIFGVTALPLLVLYFLLLYYLEVFESFWSIFVLIPVFYCLYLIVPFGVLLDDKNIPAVMVVIIGTCGLVMYLTT